MRFVEIHDFEALFGESDGGIGQYVFDGGDHIPDRLYLNSFDHENIFVFVHVRV